MISESVIWKNTRVKTPTILQMEATEDGAAALGMILGYHGRNVPLEELRLACGVSRNGIRVEYLLKAGEAYGLISAQHHTEIEALHHLPLPMIVFLNFSHYAVLEGIRRNQVYLNDPEVGPKIVSMDDFDKSFTGVVLAFSPGNTFQKQGAPSGMIRSLTSRLAGFHSALTYVILAGLFLVVPGIVIPVFSKIFVDQILVQHLQDWLTPLLLGMGLTAVLRTVLTWFQKACLLRMETKLSLVHSARFFQHVFRLPIDFFSRRFGGEVVSRVQINDKVAQLLSGELAGNVLNAVMIVFYAALMFQYDALLTGIGMGIVFFNLAALRYFSRRRIDLVQKILQDQGKSLGTAMSGLQMIETLKASGSESDFFAHWAGYQAQVKDAEQKLGVSSQMLATISTLLSALNTVAILGLGSLRVMAGEYSMGTLIAFQSLMGSFVAPINQVVNLGSQLQELRGHITRLDDVLRYPQDERFSATKAIEQTRPSTGVKLSGQLDMIDVTFGYSRMEPPLIENFNLSVKPGQRVALVGGSGSGKSTLAKLVTGLYQPWSGQILFDGKPRDDWARSLWNSSIAMVDQDIFMFEGTIRENLTLWDETVPEPHMIQAANDACIHDAITGRHGGYDSRVNEGCANFSGGQRQRLELARALVGNPTLLVLDEATSALDPTTEKQIDDNLRRRGCTCLIVAHRLTTIRDCDEIIVLNKGRVVERGTHDDMRHANGPYATLINL
ncbi:MAG: NHLP family bacteriocin export ABC transporter peptidase/permease/ATPase subunit [Desulfatirhabdiaceae bacterium]